MVISRVHLMRLSDHVIVEGVLGVDLVEAEIGDFLDSLEVEVAFDHRRLCNKELKDDKEANNRVSIEFKSFVVIFTACAW